MALLPIPSQRIDKRAIFQRAQSTSMIDPSSSVEGELSAGREDLTQFLRRGDIQLRISTIRRRLVHSPPPKLGGMAEAVALHVIVCDFDNELWTERFPRQIFALTPATLPSRHPMSGFFRRGFELRPPFPGMGGERVLSIW